MIFYITCRPIRHRNELITPKETLKNSFMGIDFKCFFLVVIDGSLWALCGGHWRNGNICF